MTISDRMFAWDGELKLKHKVDHKKAHNDFLFVFFVPILHANTMDRMQQ